MVDWNLYNKQTKGNSPRPLLVEGLSYINGKNNALDLGAGALNDTQAILENGFNHIDIVDSNPHTGVLAQRMIALGAPIIFFESTFEHFTFNHNFYDLINAQYSLPFAGPNQINKVLERVHDSLKLGGIFAGNFFGTKDPWTANPNIAFMTKTQLNSIFNSKKWNIHKFVEEQVVRPTAGGVMKKWHIIDVIAEKIL